MLNVVSDYKELIPSMGNIVNLIYPAGSYYISETTNNPVEDILNEYGISNSWVKVERFLYGGLPEGKILGDEGGEVNHTLTVAEMPIHTHSMNNAGDHSHSMDSAGTHTHQQRGGQGSGNSGCGNNNTASWYGASTSSAGAHTHTINSAGSHTHTINNTGRGSAHNNMPPYRCVNIWRRET